MSKEDFVTRKNINQYRELARRYENKYNRSKNIIDEFFRKATRENTYVRGNVMIGDMNYTFENIDNECHINAASIVAREKDNSVVINIYDNPNNDYLEYMLIYGKRKYDINTKRDIKRDDYVVNFRYDGIDINDLTVMDCTDKSVIRADVYSYENTRVKNAFRK